MEGGSSVVAENSWVIRSIKTREEEEEEEEECILLSSGGFCGSPVSSCLK